jgi:replication factor C subunit 2/4
VTRIIEPLASRCAKFRFKPLSIESMVARMNYIATSESVSLGPGALDTIMTVAEGDMRKAVTFLQSAHQLAGTAPVSVALIDDLTSQVFPSYDIFFVITADNVFPYGLSDS